ncbi:hypothetical protein ACN26Z_06255 [Verrucosispora sp. WMMD703]|uniref:Uncharacterized protein n=1 Tax=Micromonospora sediminimaris TaxID=547162 RepID=A0A9W5UQ50_9ACTN|nr:MULTISPECIES: hypothetical protein [Micromonospora]WFE44917.1 hypothetical protein O7624_11510 [Verrucosispora sp. WMMD1129]GIJ32986.1 hypothetical protein Vse01_21340 [Micromonospora sediminimaris]SFD11994.1 hypothetical protein SAMN05216284_11196 [Micromonospora sediminimaris]
MSSTSIDDLLSFSEERPVQSEPRRGGRLRTVAGVLGITAVVTVVAVAGLRAVGLRVSLLVLVAAVVALLVVRRIVATLAPPPKSGQGGSSSRGGEEPGTYNWDARDALRGAINGWATPLEWSKTRPERFTTVILPRLAELADERMRLKHGVTRESDPARARALLGDDLSTFLETPPRRTPSPRDLAAIVAELEKI